MPVSHSCCLPSKPPFCPVYSTLSETMAVLFSFGEVFFSLLSDGVNPPIAADFQLSRFLPQKTPFIEASGHASLIAATPNRSFGLFPHLAVPRFLRRTYCLPFVLASPTPPMTPLPTIVESVASPTLLRLDDFFPHPVCFSLFVLDLPPPRQEFDWVLAPRSDR